MLVLVVTADERVRSAAATALRTRRHEPRFASDADAAWTALQRGAAPMLLLDWRLSGRLQPSGLCCRLRASAIEPRPFVLAVATGGGAADLAAAVAAGADDAIAWPVDPVELERRLAVAETRLEYLVGRQSVPRPADSRLFPEKRTRQHARLVETEKLGAVGQMASGIAHDLSQVLGIIAGYGELSAREIERSDPDLTSLREWLGLIRQAAGAGGETIARLLDFARGGEAGDPAPVDVGTLLAEVVQLTAPRWRDDAQVEGRPIRVEVRAAPGLLVAGWRSMLLQALANLVLNAVDALPSGGTIELRAGRVDDGVLVEIADSGIGIPPDLHSRIFELFYTTKGSRGTGLGLAQVRSAVEQHAGRIELTSAPGAGTTFRLFLPAAESASPPPARDRSVTRQPSRAKRVLAVDDEPRLGQMVALMLSRHGHHVTTASSAEEAMARLRVEPFDAVLSDLGLGPGANGWMLARWVRAHWPDMRFVLATGWGTGVDAKEARAAGVDAIIAKPYQSEDLLRALEQPTDAGASNE